MRAKRSVSEIENSIFAPGLDSAIDIGTMIALIKELAEFGVHAGDLGTFLNDRSAWVLYSGRG